MTPPTLNKGKYRHYKGNEYQVQDVVRHSETDEWLVLYKPLYGEGLLWVRPFEMFFETVEVQGKVIPRFEYLGSES